MLALRLPFAASSGVLVTLAVFALLWHLVGVPIDVGDPLPNVKVDWKRLRVDTPVVPQRQEKKERPTPPEIPDVPDTGVTKSLDPPTKFQRASLDLVRPPKEQRGPMRPDGDVIPIVRPAPEYPPGAAARNIEGWVQVRFTVTTIGTVRDAIVVAAEPAKTFDDAALKAIARWRYNPRVENGVAAERVGLQTIIRFQLDQ